MRAAVGVVLALALALTIAGCTAPPPEPSRDADLVIETLADAAPLVEAGSLTAYATWLQDDGVRHSELADPSDAERAHWRVLMVCVTDAGEQMLFVPPDQYEELADAGISECALGE